MLSLLLWLRFEGFPPNEIRVRARARVRTDARPRTLVRGPNRGLGLSPFDFCRVGGMAENREVLVSHLLHCRSLPFPPARRGGDAAGSALAFRRGQASPRIHLFSRRLLAGPDMKLEQLET